MTSNERLGQFAPVYDYIPEDWDEGRRTLVQALRETANVANAGVRGNHVEAEVISGKTWTAKARATLSDPIVYRNVMRKVIDLGGLNDFSVTSPQNVAHGITTNANTFITALYGAASDPGASTLTAGIPLPYVDTSALGACIGLRMDATNIILVSATDYSAYTRAWIVVEYVQES